MPYTSRSVYNPQKTFRGPKLRKTKVSASKSNFEVQNDCYSHEGSTIRLSVPGINGYYEQKQIEDDYCYDIDTDKSSSQEIRRKSTE